jgi:hypothetical protein
LEYEEMSATYSTSLPIGIKKNKYYQNAHSLLFLAKALGKMTYLHSSRELLLRLPIKIAGHVIFIMINNILGIEELNRKQSNITQ